MIGKVSRLVYGYIILAGSSLCLAQSYSAVDPLPIRSQALGQIFRFEPVPDGTRTLAAGELQLTYTRAVANLWGYDKRFIIDAQTADETVALRLAPARDWLLDLGFGRKTLTPSTTDELIVGFHDLFLIPQAGRLQVSPNQTRVAIPDYGIDWTKDHHGRDITRHGYVQLGRRIWSYQDWRAHFQLFNAWEMNPSSIAGAETESTGVRLTGSWRQGLWGTLMSVTWMRHKSRSEALAWLTDESRSLLMAGVLHMSPEDEWVGQLLVHRGEILDMGQLSRSSYEVHFGYRRQWRQWRFHLAIIENIIWPYNTPDWGVSVAASYSPVSNSQ
jgi:hypothetical protein